VLIWSEVALGVLRQLVHIHNVCQRPQFVNGFQSAVALDPVFPTHEENDRRANEDDGADTGLQSLNGIAVFIELEVANLNQQACKQGNNGHTQQHRRKSQGQMRFLNPLRARDRLLGYPPQFGHDVSQA